MIYDFSRTQNSLESTSCVPRLHSHFLLFAFCCLVFVRCFFFSWGAVCVCGLFVCVFSSLLGLILNETPLLVVPGQENRSAYRLLR